VITTLTSKACWCLQRPIIKRGAIAAAVLANIVLFNMLMFPKKVKMSEERLSELSEKIIRLLIFEERFENILEDVAGEKHTHIADELKQLIARDLVRPVRDIETATPSGILYDSDMLKDYSFTLTSKGITYLETFIK
jgi:hypothetical protein